MRTRKLLLAAAAAGLVGTLGVPGTYAAFTTAPAESQSLSSAAALAAPSALSVSCVPLSGNAVLVWTANVYTVSVGYEVLRGNAGGGPYSVVHAIAPGSPTATNWTDSGAPLVTPYYYVVRATDAHVAERHVQRGQRRHLVLNRRNPDQSGQAPEMARTDYPVASLLTDVGLTRSSRRR